MEETTYLDSALDLSKALKATLFLQGSANEFFPNGLTDSAEWDAFANSWNDLKRDEYMADGGTYRFRRYSEFQIDLNLNTITVLPHTAYKQSKEINYLNGGIDRLYSPMQEDIQTNKAFQEILLRCANVLGAESDTQQYFVQVFQNRIFAKLGQIGKPTPEGIHSDGVDYVLTLMVKRHNINGGESSTYDQDKVLKTSVTLKNPGDYIFLDDNLTKHAVEPISRLDENEEGYRDVLIAMFINGTKPVRSIT